MARIDENGDRFGALIGAQFRARDREHRGDCPESETVAAYHERSLAGDERDGVERHLAGCAACREELAAIARASRDSAAVGAKPESGMRRWWTSAPVGFAIAGAIAIVVAIGLGRDYYNQESREQRQQLAMLSANRTTITAGQELHAMKRASVAKKAAESSNVAVPPSPPSQPAQASLASRAVTPEQMQATGAASSAIPGSGPATAPAIPGAAVGAATGSTLAQNQPSTFARLWRHTTVISPDGSVRWEFGSGGIIQRFGPGGMTAIRVPGVTADLLAGSAPSSAVCWIVGQGGVVLRTIDGFDWEKVNSPTSSDLIAVTASGPDAAVATARDSRRYATSDGGQTWQPQ